MVWQDHSKWCISDSAKYTACVGDINRQTSQANRGGGSLCYQLKGLWKAFNVLVEDVDSC
jgi:hypothetical protein